MGRLRPDRSQTIPSATGHEALGSFDVSWIGGNCQGDKDWECTYGTYDESIDPETGFTNFTWVTWCVDVSGGGCPSINDGGGLIGASRVSHGGGGW